MLEVNTLEKFAVLKYLRQQKNGYVFPIAEDIAEADFADINRIENVTVGRRGIFHLA